MRFKRAPAAAGRWPDLLSEAVHGGDAAPTFDDLVVAVAPTRATMTDIVGWLADETRHGHIQHLPERAAGAGPRPRLRRYVGTR
jgi:hypothetical protein